MPRNKDFDFSVDSVSDFVDEVLRYTDEDKLLCRGQQRESWTMRPRVGRITTRRGLSRIDTETILVEGFRKTSLPHLGVVPRSDWDLLAIAQHHGLATRLLDWTENPLAALWFAVRHPAKDDEDGVVWLFEPEEGDYVDPDRDENPFDVKKTMFFQPSHLNARIVAQSGWFSVHAYNEKTRRFSTLDGLARYRDRLTKALLPAKTFSNIRSDLDRLGVNQATMFPDLDGLTAHLNWLHSKLEDE